MIGDVVLVVILARIERGQGGDDRRNLLPEDTRLVELGDVRLGDALLVLVRKEDGGSVLRTDVD